MMLNVQLYHELQLGRDDADYLIPAGCRDGRTVILEGINPFSASCFQIAAVQSVQDHAGLTHHF